MRAPASESAVTTPDRQGHLVVERGGQLWGVAGHAVRRLRRRAGDGGTLHIQVSGGELSAERVLAMVPNLKVTPTPGSLTRFWPEAARGLAVYGGRPLVIIDPARPPRLLLAES